ncbi:MAG: hypothetical protein LQ350_006271 [Teloschistes chrysophthalmus]|nr:MAG: hypothetical protein LQ350_006271 [Niorma chrysophthalma]
MSPRAGFNDLPVEVHEEIVGYLVDDDEPEMLAEPSRLMLEKHEKNLKNLSLVCHYARALVLHLLFMYLKVEMHTTSVPEGASKHNADAHLQGLKGIMAFIQRNNFMSKIRALTLVFPPDYQLGQHVMADFKFKAIKTIVKLNPPTLTLMGYPALLGNLLDLTVDTRDEWAFGARLQIIRLRQNYHRSRAEKSAIWERPTSLMHSRPWEEAFFNEGSSVEAYSRYEFHTMTTPSILHTHCGWQWWSHLPAVLPFLRHFEFVAIFPLQDHMVEVSRAIESLPLLVSLKTQLTPSKTAKDNILEDRERVGKAVLSDFWSETAHSYRYLATSITRRSDKDMRLRRWTASDTNTNVDEILGEYLEDWVLVEPGLWEKSDPIDL